MGWCSGGLDEFRGLLVAAEAKGCDDQDKDAGDSGEKKRWKGESRN